MPKVFISYARDGSHGENLAAEVQLQLQAAGFEVFRDVIGLKPGDVWHSKLEFELESSDFMVLVVSEKVRTSKWVHNEVSMAEEVGIPVIPVLAEKIRQPLWLRHLQVLDFCEQRLWDGLLDALCGGTAKTTTDKPLWASIAGDDQYGRYADLVLDNVTQRFRWIHPGTFMMGSPSEEVGRYGDREVQHQVTLTKGYWLADTACTQAFWQAITDNNPANFNNNADNPVEHVSWDDVQLFIQQLNQRVRGLSARLPTEAEWEYACRAGTTTPFYFGDRAELSGDRVNYSGQWERAGSKGSTKPVKSYSSNGWGLYEMYGNVWEWCQDSWSTTLQASSISDLQGDSVMESERVVRGGSWKVMGRRCRSASRYGVWSDYRGYEFGFRLSLGH